MSQLALEKGVGADLSRFIQIGANLNSFINGSRKRAGYNDSTNIFFVQTKSGDRVIFIKLPVMRNQQEKLFMLAISCDQIAGDKIISSLTAKDANQDKIRQAIAALLPPDIQQIVDPNLIQLETIAVIRQPANAIYLSNTSNSTKPFNFEAAFRYDRVIP